MFCPFEINLILFVFVHQKIVNFVFRTGCSVYNNHLNLSVQDRILNEYCVVEKQVLNVGIKGF